MDTLFRLVAYVVIGAILLYCNILYVRILRSSFFGSNDYVIMPIKIVGKEDKDGAQGIALAQLLQARLKTVERDLADAQKELTAAPPQKPVTPRSLPGTISFIPLIKADTVNMPTSLFEPANINVAVGGVQVGGVVEWIQNLLVRRRTLTFTLYVVESNKTIVAGDVTPLSGSDNGAIWFESQSSQDAIISELSYALLLKQLTNQGGKKIEGLLSLGDFQTLADSLVLAAGLKRKAAGGTAPQKEEYAAVFEKIQPVALNISSWPELDYFTANLADSAGVNEKAILHYRAFIEAGSLSGASPNVKAVISDGTVEGKIGSLLPASPTRLAKPNQPFDVPATLEGSTAHASVYYETALGQPGPRVAQAVIGKFEADFTKLTEFFGGTKLPKSLNIVIKGGYNSAYHYGCADENLYVVVDIKPAFDTDFANFMAVSQAVDVFGAVQGKGWNCAASHGSGLKRVLAAALYPAQLGGYATAAAWLDTADRPDWVNRSNSTDVDAVSTGCAVLFLNYMHTQLKIPWNQIVQAGGTNLGQTYSDLGLGNDGFVKFRQLIDAHFPIGKPSRLTVDNPFPL